MLHHLVKDTHYRNLFEIGTGGGSCDHSARRGWEVSELLYTGIYSVRVIFLVDKKFH